MGEVGIRELRNALSRYLKRVRDGETIVVTERGRPVARIIPSSVPQDLARLVAEGRVTLGNGPLKLPQRPVSLSPGPPLSEYISEERR